MDIMIVDDDEDDVMLFREAVSTINPALVCAVARNGEEALKNLKTYARLPKCIFLDVNMPIMDGKETLRNIQQNAAYSGITIIMFSTTQNPSEIAEYLAVGVEFASKPNSFDEIVSLIRGRLAL